MNWEWYWSWAYQTIGTPMAPIVFAIGLLLYSLQFWYLFLGIGLIMLAIHAVVSE